jgi:hypothetical protein
VNVTVSLRPFESRKGAFLPIEDPRNGHTFSPDDIRILGKAIGPVADIEDLAASLRMECNVTSDQVLYWMTWPQILAHLKLAIKKQDGRQQRPAADLIHEAAGTNKTDRPNSQWSRVTTKADIAEALKLSSEDKLTALAEAGTYRLQRAGNRQSWQICLDGLSDEARKKLT